MYARLACATGWTWEYIGQSMTLPRLYAMLTYWERNPPVNESVARYLGIEAKPTPAKAVPLEETVLEFRRCQKVVMTYGR